MGSVQLRLKMDVSDDRPSLICSGVCYFGKEPELDRSSLYVQHSTVNQSSFVLNIPLNRTRPKALMVSRVCSI